MLAFIKDLDAFGYVFQLNFKENKGMYKTTLGGSLNILIKLAILIQTLVYLNDMISYKKDTITTNEMESDMN